MPEVELIDYDNFRDSDFVSELEEYGIRPTGEAETLSVYFKFADGGADLSFFTETKAGVSFIEEGGKIKSFTDLGAFVASARSLGYSVKLNNDPGEETLTITPPMGGKTAWKVKEQPKKTKSDGEESKQYKNMILVAVDNKIIGEKLLEKYKFKEEDIKKMIGGGTVATPAAGITSPKPKETAKPAEDLKQAWKDLLIELLLEPLNEAGIHKAIIEADKALKPDDPIKALHSRMAKVRKATLIDLVKDNLLTINEDGKYEVA